MGDRGSMDDERSPGPEGAACPPGEGAHCDELLAAQEAAGGTQLRGGGGRGGGLAGAPALHTVFGTWSASQDSLPGGHFRAAPVQALWWALEYFACQAS